MKPKIAIIIMCFLAGFASAQSDQINIILKNTVDLYNQHNSIECNVDVGMKYIGKDDTIRFSGNTLLIRHPSDTLFGAMIWISREALYDKIYDLDNIYSLSRKDSTGQQFEAKEELKWGLEGNIISNLKDVGFIRPDRLLTKLEKVSEAPSLSSVEQDGTEYWKIQMKFPDDPPATNIKEEYWFDKKTFTLNKMAFSLDFQGSSQYKEWWIQNIKFDTWNEDTFIDKLSGELQYFNIQPYVEKDIEERKLLEEGSIVPSFEGTVYPDSAAFSLDQLNGQIVLLDFWYMSCYPCILAIPYLNEIHEKYKHLGVTVVGVNPFDFDEKGMKRFPTFLEHNPVLYPIVFIDRKVAEEYLVRGYPTLYVIDQEGKVVFAKPGFSEDRMKEIDDYIDGLLQRD